MSKTYQYDGQQSWNYLGRFYGINPLVLASYNGQSGAKLDQPIAKGTQVKVPNALDLMSYYSEFRRQFPSMPGPQLNLPAPTVTDIKQETRIGSYVVDGKVQIETARSHAIVSKLGNPTIVTAARMRRFSHTGDNYGHKQPLRTANTNHEGSTNKQDARALQFAKSWWKCNVLVGDALHTAGFDWPMSEHKRYYQPDTLLRTMMAKNPYVDTVWAHKRFATGKIDPEVQHTVPTLDELKGIRPGDVMLLHAEKGDYPGHAGIVTSLPTLDEDGDVAVRLLDIYGETWIKVARHELAAVIRPKKKNFAPPPAQTVGGDPNKAADYLDWVTTEPEPSDEDVPEELFVVAD